MIITSKEVKSKGKKIKRNINLIKARIEVEAKVIKKRIKKQKEDTKMMMKLRKYRENKI